jgi:hypothetical protein
MMKKTPLESPNSYLSNDTLFIIIASLVPKLYIQYIRRNLTPKYKNDTCLFVKPLWHCHFYKIFTNCICGIHVTVTSICAPQTQLVVYKWIQKIRIGLVVQNDTNEWYKCLKRKLWKFLFFRQRELHRWGVLVENSKWLDCMRALNTDFVCNTLSRT